MVMSRKMGSRSRRANTTSTLRLNLSIPGQISAVAFPLHYPLIISLPLCSSKSPMRRRRGPVAVPVTLASSHPGASMQQLSVDRPPSSGYYSESFQISHSDISSFCVCLGISQYHLDLSISYRSISSIHRDSVSNCTTFPT